MRLVAVVVLLGKRKEKTHICTWRETAEMAGLPVYGACVVPRSTHRVGRRSAADSSSSPDYLDGQCCQREADLLHLSFRSAPGIVSAHLPSSGCVCGQIE